MNVSFLTLRPNNEHEKEKSSQKSGVTLKSRPKEAGRGLKREDRSFLLKN